MVERRQTRQRCRATLMHEFHVTRQSEATALRGKLIYFVSSTTTIMTNIMVIILIDSLQVQFARPHLKW